MPSNWIEMPVLADLMGFDPFIIFGDGCQGGRSFWTIMGSVGVRVNHGIAMG